MSFEYVKNLINQIKKIDFDINDYMKVVKNPFLPSNAYVNWGIHLASVGMMKEAEEKLSSSIIMASQNPEGYLNLGVVKTREGDYKEAIKMFLKAIRRDRNNSRAYCFLGNVLAETGDFEGAEKNYKEALELDTNNSDILLNWGISFLRQQKYTQAREKFKKAYKYNMANLNALYFWAISETELNEFESAKEKFQTLVSIDSSNAEGLYYLAYILYKEQNYKESLKFSLRSVNIFNKKLETYMLIAESYMNIDDEKNCMKYYEDALKNVKPNFFFYISWGISLQHFKKYEESKEKLLKAIELFPQGKLGYSTLGVAQLETKDYQGAEENFKKALEIDKEDAISLDKLGDIKYLQKDYSAAINYFKSAIKSSANLVQIYAKIAKAYFVSGENENSNLYYEKAIEYSPRDIQLFIVYAGNLIIQKDYRTAMRKIRAALKIDDKNIDCLHLLFYLHYLLAKENIYDYNVKEAIEIADKIKKEYPESFKYENERAELETILKERK